MERKLSDMMCRSFIKGNEVPDTSSVGSIDAETVALARSINLALDIRVIHLDGSFIDPDICADFDKQLLW